MRIFPAIDIMSGRVVRLISGDERNLLEYPQLRDPLKVAELWVSKGASFLHVIDLDGAKGVGDNTDIILAIVRSTHVNIQVGGGIRSLAKARFLLDKGVYRVIIGSLAIESPFIVKQIIEEYGDERLAVALDYDDDGSVLYRGWGEKSGILVEDAISLFSNLGCKYFLLTSASRDGSLSGPDTEYLGRIATFGRIIAAGGIESMDDVILLKKLGVYGVVIGRALYEDKIDLELLLEMVCDDASS